MYRFITLLFIGTLLTAPATMADNGMSVLESRHDSVETEKRLLSAIDDAGMQVIATIDHAAAAQKAGMTLDPTRLIIFGNPKVGTQLMHCGRTVAIDLPMKMLIWDDNGVTRVGYNTPYYLAERHDLSGCEALPGKIEKVLSGLARQASGIGSR